MAESDVTYPKASEVIRWAADHLDITDRLVVQVAKAKGVEMDTTEPTDAAQQDLRAIADWLEAVYPAADDHCGQRCERWAQAGASDG